MTRTSIVLLLAATLGGCLAQAAVDVVTLPVRAGAKAVDWATTSQDEADRNRGRRERKAEKRERKEAAKAAREARRRDD